MNLSGIENQLDKIMSNQKEIDKSFLSKLLMDAIIRNMFKSLSYLCEKHGVYEVVFAGGVSASKYISKNLTQKLKKLNLYKNIIFNDFGNAYSKLAVDFFDSRY